MLNSEPTPRTRVDCACPRARHEHGTLGAYQIDGCRCFRCCFNRSEARRRYGETGDWREYAWQSAVGVARRLQALSAIGYSDRQLAQHTGIHVGHVIRLRVQGVAQVTAPTFEKVARCYDALWCVPCIGPYATRTRLAAARKGWLPPLAWDDDHIDDPQTWRCPRTSGESPTPIDEIAVERAMRGDPVRLTNAEKSAAHARLNHMGLSASVIAERLGTTTRSVTRRRAAA